MRLSLEFPGAFGLACAALLGACAVGGEGPLRTGDPCTQGFVDEVALARQLVQAKPCCSDFTTMTFAPVRKSEILRITADAPVFDFASGRSRFIGVDLAGFESSRAVLTPMSSTAMTAPADHTCSSGLADVSHRAVQPAVQWLDASKRAVGPADRGSLTVTRGAAGWAFARPPQARYMVIYSVPSEHGQRLDLPAPRAGILTTDTVGLAAALHPQRTVGPARFTASATGYFESLDP